MMTRKRANALRVREQKGSKRNLRTLFASWRQCMSTQIFTTIPQQISILKSRGLKFHSESDAEVELQRHGYYNIINGYKDNYVIKDSSGEHYKDEVYFEQIYALFNIDHDIRNGIMVAMLEVEEQLKTQLAYVIAHNFTSNYAQYSKISNYRNVHVNNKRFTLAATLAILDQTYHSDKEPVLYNRTTYNNVPPWVLFKCVFLSTIVTLVRFLKGPQKEELFSLMFDVPASVCKDSLFKAMCTDILAMFKEYRNVCAHGGRIYNHISTSTYTANPAWFSLPSNVFPSSGIGSLVIALSLLRDQRPYDYLTRTIQTCVSAHCQQYPDDTDYIVDSMGIRDLVDIHTN